MNFLSRMLAAAALFILAGCQIATPSPTGYGDIGYLGLTKRQLLQRLGPPAEIHLLEPQNLAPEIWVYYTHSAERGVLPANFQFRNGVVEGSPGLFFAAQLLSTDSPTDLELIAHYKAQFSHHASPR